MSYSDDTFMGHDLAQMHGIDADDSDAITMAKSRAIDLLEQLIKLPVDQHGERCLLPGDMAGKDWGRAGAVGYSLIRGWITLKGISHKRVLICLADEGFLAISGHQRGWCST